MAGQGGNQPRFFYGKVTLMKKKLLRSLPLMLLLVLFLPLFSLKAWAKESGKHQIAVTLNEASWQNSSGSNRMLPMLKLADEKGNIVKALEL